MVSSESVKVFMTVSRLRFTSVVDKERKSLTAKSFGRGGAAFQDFCEDVLKATSRGLTSLADVKRNGTGDITEILFESILTPTGEKMSLEAVPRPDFRQGMKAGAHKDSEEQLRGGDADSSCVS